MQKQTSPTAFDEEVMNELRQTKKLLEELIETVDIIKNPEEMKKLAASEKDLKEGRVRKFSEFLKEVNE